MTWAIDRRLSWIEHYLEYGFALIKRAVGDEFIKPALEEVYSLQEHRLPLREWNKLNTPPRWTGDITRLKVLPQVYDQPGVRRIIDAMFASPNQWNGERHFQLFINPYDPEAKAEVCPEGHIDFVDCPIPVLGSGFMFQLSLVESEPFSGNLTLYPGTHKPVLELLKRDPSAQYNGGESPIRPLLKTEPFEFVAEPGDMVIFHHLVGHAGNSSHAANRSPRVSLHCQANRKTWLKAIDPATPGLSPWEKSLTHGGAYTPPYDELETILAFRKKQKEAAARR